MPRHEIDDRARDRAARVLRLFAQRRRSLEADEGKDREDHALADAGERSLRRVVRVERLQRQVARVREQDPDRERGEDADLEDAEDHARVAPRCGCRDR